jgi:peptidoglycan/xylan/chitin deacetylase (PgdA/CDA1 family)
VPQRVEWDGSEVEKKLVLDRVKQNGSDIEKYFVLDDERRIIVKANLRDDTDEYEVVYDLEGAEALADSTYRVHFAIQSGRSGASLNDSLIWRPRPASAGLLLAFDDDYMNSWEQHFDLFDKYNAKITFFIQGELNPFCAKALNRGHDVGYHSLNHLDLRKTSMAEFAAQTLDPAEAFRQAKVPLSSFAYPFGFSEPWMHEILFQSYTVLRGYGVTFRLYHKDKIRSAYIVSRAIDNIVIPADEDFDKAITLMLRTASFLEGNWVLPLTTHDISEAASWGISPRRLEFLLKTTADFGIVFYRYSDFAGKPTH